MAYRTRTYIAGDWTGDHDAINQLYKWNDGDWKLSFTDAHELTQARDSSLNCSIKRSLKERMDASKTFVLVVGEKTDTITSGGCQLCSSYNSWNSYCAKGYSVDYRSYIKYECDLAIKAEIKIVVLYNSTYVNKDNCPESIRKIGTHIPMIYKGKDNKYYWDYNAVKNALTCNSEYSMIN